MTPWPELEAQLARHLQPERLAHVYRVRDTAVALAGRFGADPEQAALAALGHDYCRAMAGSELLEHARRRHLITDPVEEAQPLLLHGPVAAALLQEQGLVTDSAVLDAIRWHTTGRAGMSLLERVIWVADYIEPGRNFPGVGDIRREAERNLDNALLIALDSTLRYVLQRGWLLHTYSVHARNWLLMRQAP